MLNHLLYEGLDISVAEHDAYAWALYSSDETMQLIRSQERRYKAKYELRKTEILMALSYVHDSEMMNIISRFSYIVKACVTVLIYLWRMPDLSILVRYL